MAGDKSITQTVNKNTTKVEQQVKNTTNNINIDLSKIDMTGAIESFTKLEEVAKASNFDTFITKILDLRQVFIDFQKAVQESNTSIKNFSTSSEKFDCKQTATIEGDIDNSINVDLSNLDKAIENLSVAFEALTGPIEALGQVFINITGMIKALGQAFIDIGTGINQICIGIAELFKSFKDLGEGLIATAAGVAALIPLLPQLGTSMLQMAINTSGIIAYLPDLLVFLGVLLVMSLLGEGLMAAGNGMLNIGAGLTSMTEGMAALLAFMPVFIASLAGITDNIGGIVLFVLLAAAMLVMAIAVQMMNEQMTQFVDNMTRLTGLMSVGFVAGFAVFAIMLIAMSFFMDSVANGIQKVTDAMTQQCAKLAILNPLLAAYAILSNPFMGAVTVGLAIAGGLLVKALLPAMATGGVVSSPTVAMVGEGRYPEAVVPLGDSPQFASMKADIANAVLTALNATGGGTHNNGKPIELTVNLDSKTIAKQLYSPLQLEAGRRGH